MCKAQSVEKIVLATECSSCLSKFFRDGGVISKQLVIDAVIHLVDPKVILILLKHFHLQGLTFDDSDLSDEFIEGCDQYVDLMADGGFNYFWVIWSIYQKTNFNYDNFASKLIPNGWLRNRLAEHKVERGYSIVDIEKRNRMKSARK